MKRFFYYVRRVRLVLAEIILGEKIYNWNHQEIRHNIISKAINIKWLAKSRKDALSEICEFCKEICSEVDKIS